MSEKAGKKPVKKDEKKPNALAKLVKPVKDTAAELKKVSWPSRKELISYTILVSIFVLIVAAVVGVFDVGLSALYQLVFGA